MASNPANLHFPKPANTLSPCIVKLLLTFIALTATCIASEEEISASALKFLNKVRLGEVDLKPGADTAISPQTTPAKTESINRRLGRMAYEIDKVKLITGKVKISGDLAGVMVWQAEGFGTNDMRVFPLAMVKKDGKWLPAPIPASFDNSGVGYDAESIKRINTLENWMRQQQVFDLANLRNQVISRMQQSVSKEFDVSAIKKLNAKEVTELFIDACLQKNTYKILGFLGGLSKSLPDDWSIRARSVRKAMSTQHTPVPWSFLCSPNALRIIVNFEEDKDSALVSVACLDPSYQPSNVKTSRIQIVHLNFEKSDAGLWQINLPATFHEPSSDYKNTADPSLDQDLFVAFIKKIRERNPATPHATPEKTRAAIAAALQKGSLNDIIKIVHLPESSTKAQRSLTEASQLWWNIRGTHSKNSLPTISHLIPLDIKTMDEDAILSYQWFSARQPGRFQLKLLYLKRTKDGWLWNLDPETSLTESFKEWEKQQEEKWAVFSWQEKLLSPCPVISKIPDARPPSVEASRKLVTSWLKAIEDGNVSKAIEHCALLNLKDSPTALLRNLGYDVNGAIKRDKPAEMGIILQNKLWTGVGVNSSVGTQAAFPFYPIVNTKDGPKILLEIDLLATGGRGRTFLNRTSINRLSNFNVAESKSLNELFSKFEEKVLKSP